MTDATPQLIGKNTGSEDFSFFAQQVPGLFVFIGATLPGEDMASAAPNHARQFLVDGDSLLNPRPHGRFDDEG